MFDGVPLDLPVTLQYGPWPIEFDLHVDVVAQLQGQTILILGDEQVRIGVMQEGYFNGGGNAGDFVATMGNPIPVIAYVSYDSKFATPEPSTFAMAGAALLAVGVLHRNRRRK